MVDLVIRNGRVVTPSGVIYGGISVEGEKITFVGGDSSLPPEAKRVIDAKENFVIPGLIDAHVHIPTGVASGTTSYTDIDEVCRTQFETETKGACYGGVTTCGNFISSSIRPTLATSVERISSIGEDVSYIDFFSHALVTGADQLAEMPELCRQGVTSFKHMFNAYKEAGRAADEGILFRSLEFIAKYGYPALGMVHCEEIDIINVLTDRLREAGRTDLAAWTEGRPNFTEYMRIAHALEIAKATGAPLYIVHISTGEGAELVATARQQGYAIYGETCPTYLTHTAEMEGQIGCWGKVNPPLRYLKDNARLWRAILEGGITNMGTDHGSFPIERKEQGKGKHDNIWDALIGICGGMEHLLPVMMTYGVNAGRISIEDLVRICATNNAKVFGLYPRKGVLSAGSDADIVLVDPAKEATINKGFYHGQSDFSIYYGWAVKGMARTTIIRGEVMVENYELVGKPGHGKYVPRKAY